MVFGVGKCGYMEYSDCMEKGSVVFGVTNRVFISIVIWSYIITDALFHVRHVFK